MRRLMIITLALCFSSVALGSRCEYELAFYNIALESRNLNIFSHNKPKTLRKVNGLLQKPTYYRDFKLGLASQEEKNLAMALNCDTEIVLLVVTDVDHNTQRVIRHKLGETVVIF